MSIRRAYPSVSIIGCDPQAGADAERVVDQVVASADDLAHADLIVACVPVAELPRCLETIARTSTAALVTDVGSTKRGVMAAAAQAGLRAFVGGHPMAGSERPGLESARADLFAGRPWLLVKGSATADASAALEAFLGGLGARTMWMGAAEHDRAVAYVSHLPQLVAAALMNTAERATGETGAAVAGNAFAEMTRLASSPPAMWASVLGENADYVTEALEAFGRQLPGTRDRPGEWVRAALERSGEARARWRRRSER